jgi:hypothetical protein
MLRMAVTVCISRLMARSASGLASAASARGYGATMIDSPTWGSRCQMSSVMNGMNGWSSRSVVSSTVTSVCCTRWRSAGSPAR